MGRPMLDVEAEARWLLRDFDPLDPPSAEELIQEHLGDDAIRLFHLRGHDAETVYEWGEPKVLVRHGLDPVRRRFVLLHELAEVRLAKLRYKAEDIDQQADALAAALVAPREAFVAALRLVGADFTALAELFLATETCMALRYGEVTGRPTAVVAPATVRLRGEEWGWPSEHALRGLAQAKEVPREVERVSLTDDKRRRVLLAS